MRSHRGERAAQYRPDVWECYAAALKKASFKFNALAFSCGCRASRLGMTTAVHSGGSAINSRGVVKRARDVDGSKKSDDIRGKFGRKYQRPRYAYSPGAVSRGEGSFRRYVRGTASASI
jgi:hypothetical protein